MGCNLHYMSNKEYLGDSVYVEIENGMLRLSTNNGLGDSNEIYLEGPVYKALIKYVTRLHQKDE